mmetsp:Transcript_23222/g.67045  ORF Transcript_23222/g.67045 Transcript_23222/m.67045 type:complete len:350 (-) Transcript_23222:296-1345(-)
MQVPTRGHLANDTSTIERRLGLGLVFNGIHGSRTRTCRSLGFSRCLLNLQCFCDTCLGCILLFRGGVLQLLLFSSGFILEFFLLGRHRRRRSLLLPLFHLSSLALHFLCLLLDTLFLCLLLGLDPGGLFICQLLRPGSLFICQLLDPGGLLFRSNASLFCLLGGLALSFLFEFRRLLGSGTFGIGRLLLGLLHAGLGGDLIGRGRHHVRNILGDSGSSACDGRHLLHRLGLLAFELGLGHFELLGGGLGLLRRAEGLIGELFGLGHLVVAGVNIGAVIPGRGGTGSIGGLVLGRLFGGGKDFGDGLLLVTVRRNVSELSDGGGRSWCCLLFRSRSWCSLSSRLRLVFRC